MLRVLEPPPPGVLVQPVLLDYGAVAEEIGWVGVETGVDNPALQRARTERLVRSGTRDDPEDGAFTSWAIDLHQKAKT